MGSQDPQHEARLPGETPAGTDKRPPEPVGPAASFWKVGAENSPPAVAPPPVRVPRSQAAAPPVSIPTALPSAPPPLPRGPVTLAGAWLRERTRWLRFRRRELTSFGTSALVHSALLVILGLWFLAVKEASFPPTIVATLSPSEDAGGAITMDHLPEIDVNDLSMLAVSRTTDDVSVSLSFDRLRQAPEAYRLPIDAGIFSSGWMHSVEPLPLGLLEGRGKAARELLLKEEGGNQESEEAVERGLRWLAAHQRENGSWHFDLTQGPCAGLCANSGRNTSTTAATGLALLAFLGHGNTHESGEYREVVAKGIDYLQSRAVLTPDGADLRDGTMYGQGLATMALCEDYAMTRDRGLEKFCQAAVNFIIYCQDKNGGGWRYTPGQPGDTTVTGWQLMALKSGQLNYLTIPEETLTGAKQFLDTVSSDQGAFYGYQSPGREPTNTAVGLLCRMYSGWQHDHPALTTGIRFISRQGPSPNNLYYDYYATQVMHHWGGSPWEVWNGKMRDYLIKTQWPVGHEAGSWFFEDEKTSSAGGRLYTTCMAIMTLEVYYRYLPLYGPNALKKSF